MKTARLLLLILLAPCGILSAQDNCIDLMSDTWVATDALGRQMPLADSAGPVKTDHRRTVGIFYITWHTQNLHDIPGPYTDVSRILHEDPSARLRDDHPLWRYGSYHWGEPEMGYFLSQDEWVIRRDMSMLADAGVDVLVLDVTNGVCYWDEWEVLFSTMTKMRAEGNQTPQFVFWSYNGGPVGVVKSLYERIYKEKRYADLWFYWDGKPLLLYNADPSYDANGTYSDASADDYPQEIRDFFTLRNMWWGYYTWHGNRFIGTEDNWSFGYSMADKQIIGMKPEELVSKHNGQPEEAAVTPAQHPVTMTDVPMGVGKSWSRQGGEPQLNEYDMPSEAYVPWLGRTVSDPAGYGIYFQERWDDALAADPPFIYLNDWNEWTAGMYERGKKTMWLGRESPYIFIDQYNAEFNRTIQPMHGGYTDNYYMQMVQNIRRYKGVREIPITHGYGVEAVYRDTRGDVAHRDHDGYAGLHYTDSTGRNDIVECRVSVTQKEVCFQVLTAGELTPRTDPNWMLLLIDTDCNAATGWVGYDFLVKRGIGYRWDATTGEWIGTLKTSHFVIGTDNVRFCVPRKLVGMTGKTFSFDFKWTDNPTALDNIITVATTGDTAPNRRFNYRFIFNKK
ncbi:MAG: hypothetical protein IKH59_05755 [Bacteroidaceae bacterium]|nr:hypothetical protein [Bacteroidaceae bacterium]